jgi:hypothetical protein
MTHTHTHTQFACTGICIVTLKGLTETLTATGHRRECQIVAVYETVKCRKSCWGLHKSINPTLYSTVLKVSKYGWSEYILLWENKNGNKRCFILLYLINVFVLVMAHVCSFTYLCEQFNIDPELNCVLTCGNMFSAFFLFACWNRLFVFFLFQAAIESK